MSLEKSAGPTSGTRRSRSMTLWTGRLARLRRHHVSAYGVTVIDNAGPVIDNAQRVRVRDVMERYRKRRKCIDPRLTAPTASR
jgi:hypothetical protein